MLSTRNKITSTAAFALKGLSGAAKGNKIQKLNILNLETRKQPYYTHSKEPFHPIVGKLPKRCTPEEAVTVVKSGEELI